MYFYATGKATTILIMSLSRKDQQPRKRFMTLSRSLVFWFLFLTLMPLTLISYIEYQQASEILKRSVSDKLHQASGHSLSFIQSWFRYRMADIRVQAQNHENRTLLTVLEKAYNKSGLQLAEFVRSTQWRNLVSQRQGNLLLLQKEYDYIYDLFLVDRKGNLLFSVARESDLGTNLLHGTYAQTQFAKTVARTLKTGEYLFSDLERYAPSDNIIAGFLTAPMKDKAGKIIGVFATQIKIDKVLQTINIHASDKYAINHYLVGTDGLLRSAYDDKAEDILVRKIASRQFQIWYQEHAPATKEKELLPADMDERAIEYTGPAGNRVIGIHQAIMLPGVSWALISEMSSKQAFAPINWLFNMMLSFFLFTILLVATLAIYQARKISQPVIRLARASLEAAQGHIHHPVEVEGNNEISDLAEAFNHMLEVRKRHEDELEQTTAQAESAYMELAEQKFALDQHSIVAITDVKGTITFANQKFSEISGYSIDELIGNNHRMLKSGVHDREFFRAMYRKIARGKIWQGEICNRAKSGKLYWLDTTIVPFMNEDGKPRSYIAIRTDITQRKQAEQELIEAKEQAEAATRQKSEFLANMSHEIRTPMNGIIGMTGLLLDTDLSAKQRSYAENTMNSAEALLSIINDILDFSKIEAGKMELELVPFDLQSLAEDVAELMAIKCREKDLEMLLRVRPGTQRNLVGDPGRVRQILLNLLSNAIKFTEHGAIVLAVESSEVVNNKARITLSVQDSGIGIEASKLDTIFNKFDQEDSSTTRKYGGTGLGLSICRQLSQMMNGDIRVESEKGKGSTFIVDIELELATEPLVSSYSDADINILQGLKTLIVDDMEMARAILEEQLSPLGMEVESVPSADMALLKLNQAQQKGQPYDIVIIDFYMPGMDGEMLAAEIKQQKLLPQGALVFITSSPRKGDGQRLKKLGFDAYLTKPTRENEVAQILGLVWQSRLEHKDIPLVTRHMIREVKTGNRKHIQIENAHILLVEDNPVNQMVATEYLERYGCSVTPAGNGIEAVSQFKHSEFDLVFMDCQMPEMDGYEATRVIREWEQYREKTHTPIIAFTANAMQGDKDKCIVAGMDDYISKPVSEKSLEDMLKKWLKDKVEIVEFEYTETPADKEAESEKQQETEPRQLDLSVFNVLKQMFADNFPKAVQSHTTTSKDNLQRVEQALKDNDAEALEHAAHSLKGAAAQFGAMQLSELARQAEFFGKDNDIESARAIFEQLKTAREQAEQLMQKNL